MGAEHPSQKPQPEMKFGAPRWALFGGLGLGGLVLAALLLWLLWGGTATVMSWLPSGVAKSLGEKTGEGKVIQPQADPNGEPWQAKSYTAHDKPAHEDKPDEPADEASQAEAATAAIHAAAKTADEAIAAFKDKPNDQAKFHAAERALEDLRTAEIPKTTAALAQAAKEQRADLYAKKKQTLDDTQRLGKATHKVKADTTLRKAADDASEDMAHLPEGTLVKQFLETGTGWARVEAVSGDVIGKGGYARVVTLEKLKK